jgi:hypothetical protein
VQGGAGSAFDANHRLEPRDDASEPGVVRRLDDFGDVLVSAGRFHRHLAKLRKWITATDPGEEFRSRLRAALDAHFGSAADVGVFVRSGTNVEDLPGFTGAGLNRTVPNVVGFEKIVAAVQEV